MVQGDSMAISRWFSVFSIHVRCSVFDSLGDFFVLLAHWADLCQIRAVCFNMNSPLRWPSIGGKLTRSSSWGTGSTWQLVKRFADTSTRWCWGHKPTNKRCAFRDVELTNNVSNPALESKTAIASRAPVHQMYVFWSQKYSRKNNLLKNYRWWMFWNGCIDELTPPKKHVFSYRTGGFLCSESVGGPFRGPLGSQSPGNKQSVWSEGGGKTPVSLTWKKMENGPTFSVIFSREYIFKLGPLFPLPCFTRG